MNSILKCRGHAHRPGHGNALPSIAMLQGLLSDRGQVSPPSGMKSDPSDSTDQVPCQRSGPDKRPHSEANLGSGPLRSLVQEQGCCSTSSNLNSRFGSASGTARGELAVWHPTSPASITSPTDRMYVFYSQPTVPSTTSQPSLRLDPVRDRAASPRQL